MENQEALKKLRDLYVKSLDDLIVDSDTPWIDIDKLADITGTTVSDITNVVLNFDDFVENSKGKISTRKNYKKKTSFLKQLRDSSTGIIE